MRRNKEYLVKYLHRTLGPLTQINAERVIAELDKKYAGNVAWSPLKYWPARNETEIS